MHRRTMPTISHTALCRVRLLGTRLALVQLTVFFTYFVTAAPSSNSGNGNGRAPPSTHVDAAVAAAGPARAYVGKLLLNVSDSTPHTDSVLPFFKFMSNADEGGIGFAYPPMPPAMSGYAVLSDSLPDFLLNESHVMEDLKDRMLPWRHKAGWSASDHEPHVRTSPGLRRRSRGFKMRQQSRCEMRFPRASKVQHTSHIAIVGAMVLGAGCKPRLESRTNQFNLTRFIYVMIF